jgi:hypothetical protein
MIRAPTDEMWDRRRVLSCYIDLTDVVPELDLCDRAWPIWTYAEITPPAKIVHDEEGRRGQIVTLLVSGGIISGAALHRSLLFTSVHVNSFANVGNAVVLPYVSVGRHARQVWHRLQLNGTSADVSWRERARQCAALCRELAAVRRNTPGALSY